MDEQELEYIGNCALFEIKKASWFPYKKGNLKFHATNGRISGKNTYCITFSEQILKNKTGKEYITYLEDGTRPHNIPHAFGRPLPFGTYGRFNGMFHPGSTKHKGFIKDKSVPAIARYIADTLNGEIIIE